MSNPGKLPPGGEGTGARRHSRGDKLRRALRALELLHSEPMTAAALTTVLGCAHASTERLLRVLRSTPGLRVATYRQGRDFFYAVRPSWISAGLRTQGDAVRQGLRAIALLDEKPHRALEVAEALRCERRTVERMLRVLATQGCRVITERSGREASHRIAEESPLLRIIRSRERRPSPRS